MTDIDIKKNLKGLLLSSRSYIPENDPHQLENHLHRLENDPHQLDSHPHILENVPYRLVSDRHGQKVDLLEMTVLDKKFRMMIIPYLGNNFQIKIKELKFIKEVEYVFYSKKYAGTFSKCQNGPY